MSPSASFDVSGTMRHDTKSIVCATVGVMAPITVTMNAQGRIVIPAEVRAKLGLEAGAALLLHVDDDEVRLVSPRAERRKLQRQFAHLRPSGGPLASDDLIAERRVEAILEQIDDIEERRRVRRALDR